LSQDTPHVYRIKTYSDIASGARFFLPADSIVEFRAVAEAVPLPEPYLLSMHHALAEVLNASGMGETVDRYLRDLEELKCLAEDGSTHSALVSVGLAVKVFMAPHGSAIWTKSGDVLGFFKYAPNGGHYPLF
jgi:hypothetical protein